MKKIYSFDIFDTCLLRKCGSFENLYYLLAVDYLGKEASYDDIEDFVYNRITTEFFFQNTSPNLVTLQEICKYMEKTYGISDWKSLYDLELKLTEQQLVGVYDLISYINNLRNSPDNEIIFISDMFLPKTFLERVLIKNGLFKSGDKLFVSCELGKTKSEGTLYDFIADQMSIKDKSIWTHTGDNLYSDIVIPQKKGINTKKINHLYSYYEKFYLERSFFCNHRETAKIMGSYLMAYRLSLPDKTYKTEFAIDVIASLYIPYVIWLLKDAKERNINHLLFLARDSEIFYEIAKSSKQFSEGIKLSYIYVSRKSLGFVSESVENSNIFRDYLIQEGVSEKENVGLVDLGWSGSSRHHLGRLFLEYGLKEPFTYYWGYWGSEKPEYSTANSVPMKAFNYLYANHEMKMPGYAFPMLFEHYMSITSEGSTLLYKRDISGKVYPVKDKPENVLEEVVEIHHNVVRDLTTMFISNSAVVDDIENIYSVVGRSICESLLKYPTRKDIKLLKEIRISHNGAISFLIGRINFIQRIVMLLTGNIYGGYSSWKIASLYDSPLRSLYVYLYPRTSNSYIGKIISKILQK